MKAETDRKSFETRTLPKRVLLLLLLVHIKKQAGEAGEDKAGCHAPPGVALGAAGSHFRPWQPSYGWRP